MEKLTNNLEKNLNYIKDVFTDCADVAYREVEIGIESKIKIVLIFIDAITNKEFISGSAIQSLFWGEEINYLASKDYDVLFDRIAKEALSSSEIKNSNKLEDIVNSILSGDTILLMEKVDRSIIIDSKNFPSRSPDEPQTETTIRGPRDGFTEIFKVNTALVRKRIKDTNLKIKYKDVGRRSKTTVAILYMDDIVDKKIVSEVEKRLAEIDIDAILESSILEHLIEDNYLSIFSQIENTERPDSVASALYEGRVAIVVDNSPFVLIVPATLGTMLQSSEDYYTRWTEASIVRLIRVIAIFLIFLPPALYIAISSYHPGLLPTKLIYFLAASRINVPFPAVIEALLMELTMELLRESGTRLAGPIGSTIGIVGGLIIGQAAVEAGIVSPLMIIIVAITTISSFVVPSYELSAGLRITKFTFIILAGIFGLYGVMLGVILLISHLTTLTSFGIPFTTPFSGLGIEEGDLKDTLVKAPIQRLWMRPGFTHPRNKRRMRVKKDE